MYQQVVNSNERWNKKSFLLWASSISFSLLLSAALLAVSMKDAKPKSIPYSDDTISRVSSTSIVSPCKSTLYPIACKLALSSAAGKASRDVFHTSVQFTINQVHSTLSLAQNLTGSHATVATIPSGMDDCLELLNISLDQLHDVLHPAKTSSTHDIQTWLSAALTNQETCKESLQIDPNSPQKESMNAQVQNLAQLISNSLALLMSQKPRKLPRFITGSKHRRLLQPTDLPSWVSHGDRKLLEASPADIRADAVVAQDGSGSHRTINEAIAFVSLAGGGGGVGGRSVIYVKAGTYEENINIPTKRKNVMLMGDGKGKTVIVGGRNAEDGYSTYQSATVAAMGSGFIGKGLTIINNAGPSKHQAVALRVGADLSVVTQCSIEGYQDTLYTHSNRQFYRDNDIYGTVDFIFGNSAAVFQNCFIQPRRPSGGQRNSITAQGRKDKNQNTGISIHNCKIQGAADLGGTPTYLGRPWQIYSRTIVMETSIDGSVSKAGWEEWSGSFALSTLYYGEYGNTGPGASVSGRVSWPGVHSSMSLSEASQYTVAKFIFGDQWLPGTGVPYTPGL